MGGHQENGQARKFVLDLPPNLGCTPGVPIIINGVDYTQGLRKPASILVKFVPGHLPKIIVVEYAPNRKET